MPASQLKRLQDYVNGGGSILVLAGGMKVSPQVPMANPQPLPWNTLLQHFGVSVRGDMAYDLVANEAIPVPSDFGRVMQVYPFFIRAESSRLSPVNKDIGAVVLTWASTIDTTKAAKGTVTPLLATSRAAGTFTNATSIDPRSDFPKTDLGRKLLGVLVSSKDSARAPVRGAAPWSSEAVTSLPTASSSSLRKTWALR